MITWQINNTWPQIALKRVVATKVTDGPHETPKILDFGVPFLSAESIKDYGLDFNFKRGFISQEDHDNFCLKCKPQLDDIFMVKSGATTGKIAMVNTEEEFSIWSPLALIRANREKILPKYLYYVLISPDFQEQIQSSWSFGTQQNIGMGVIENLTVPLPPVVDQIEIITYLEHELKVIDELRAEKERFSQLLDLKRAAVIAEAVTGRLF